MKHLLFIAFAIVAGVLMNSAHYEEGLLCAIAWVILGCTIDLEKAIKEGK